MSVIFEMPTDIDPPRIAIVSAYLKTTSFFESIASSKLNQPYARFYKVLTKYQAPPVHTIIISFATCGFLLLALGHHCPALFKISYGEHNHTTLPLQKPKLNTISPRSSSHLHLQNGNSYTTRKSSLVLLAAVFALSLRVELYRRIQNAPQCTKYSFEVRKFERGIGCF
jgi:hypothetical protein